jgi:hypothetical protein
VSALDFSAEEEEEEDMGNKTGFTYSLLILLDRKPRM